VTDDSSLLSPVFIGNKEYAFCVGEVRMFEDVEFFKLFMIQAQLLDELRFAEDQEWFVSNIGQVSHLVRVLL
jgi:hypothetical protein